jgi:hypothetical protein
VGGIINAAKRSDKAGLFDLTQFNLKSGVICAGDGLDTVENGD